MVSRSRFASSLVCKVVTLGAACAFAFAGAACAVDSTSPSSEAASQEQAHVRADGEGLRIQIGADEVAALQTEGGREVR
jgi:hypothetical protein